MSENKEKLIFICVVCLLLIGFFYRKVGREKEVESLILEETAPAFEEDKKADGENLHSKEENILIHLSGEIKNPGIIELKTGDRLIDAVELAGGLKTEADLRSINLAKRVVDEEKIHIPKLGEEEVLIQSGNLERSSGKNQENGNLVELNNCSREELLSLPGIGEKTADKIIEYRQVNKFETIDDIKNVSGIGDKKFEGMRDLIKLR